MDCSCAPILRFLSVASPIMHRFGGSFRSLLEDWMCFATLYTIRSSVGRRFRHKIRKFAAVIFKKKHAKKSTAELCQILRMVTVEQVINSTRVMSVRVTISCRYALSLMGRCFFLVLNRIFLTVSISAGLTGTKSSGNAVDLRLQGDDTSLTIRAQIDGM